MKKIFALLLAVTMLAALSVTALADFTYEGLFTDYDVLTPGEISFSYVGETSATAFPRGGGTLECLIDGEHLAAPTTHTDKGIVLVCNDFIKPEYERKNGQTIQASEAIPVFSFTLTYGEEVTFDSVYLSLFYMAFDCVCAPGEHKVVVETSDDGELWIPVGTDGSFYFRDNQPIYTGNKDPYSEEIVVPLGEEVTAQYVRLSFKFKELDAADDYWDYYTNVYEWCGFTELGVAQYAGGDEVPPMTQEEAAAPDVVLEGLWYAESEEEETVLLMDLTTPGVMKTYLYGLEDFNANGQAATVIEENELPYVAEADYIVVEMDGMKNVLFVTVGEDTIEMDEGEGPVLYEPYVPEEPEVSEEESSEPEESSKDEESSEDESSEPEESSEAPATSAPATSTPATSSEAPAEDGGDSTLLIVIIAVVAVVIIGVVVVVVIKKKK
ncbi:MAG: hypothetical protein E7651_08790 [Ruminococcaceae bacterium]|nr:hypothetical protein [Oscillospiraceae bacterium]